MCGVVGSERKIKRVWDTSQQAKYNVFSEKGTLFLCLLFSFVIGKDRKGMERKRGLLLTKHSASMTVSKHSICSSSESRKEFSLESAVERTDCMDCSAVFKAAPANHFALWVSGSLAISNWNWFLPFTFDGASKSWISLNTLMMYLFSLGQNSAINRMTAILVTLSFRSQKTHSTDTDIFNVGIQKVCGSNIKKTT